jgi:ClpP class serine protease
MFIKLQWEEFGQVKKRLDLELVDEIGNLESAINFAANKVGIRK